jgi:hypothetical protein
VSPGTPVAKLRMRPGKAEQHEQHASNDTLLMGGKSHAGIRERRHGSAEH